MALVKQSSRLTRGVKTPMTTLGRCVAGTAHNSKFDFELNIYRHQVIMAASADA